MSVKRDFNLDRSKVQKLDNSKFGEVQECAQSLGLHTGDLLYATIEDSFSTFPSRITARILFSVSKSKIE